MEQISAMMDGELNEAQMARQLARLRTEPGLRESWDTFHVIGDALRGERPLSDAFAQRVIEKLESEPIVIAPQRNAGKRTRTTYVLSAAASLSAIAVVGWLAFFNNPLVPQTQIATAPQKAAPTVAAVPSPQMTNVPSDGTMNEYLIAHQEYSPSTAIQGLAPYIRTVSSAQPEAGR
jgi:sigma-E factor negative regulatory protein RseA